MLWATCYRTKLYYCPNRPPCPVTQTSSCHCFFIPAFHHILRPLMLCLPPADFILVVPNFVVLGILQRRRMGVKRSATWILEALRLCVKVESRCRFLIVLTSFESPLLGSESSKGCTSATSVCLSYVLLALRPICRSFVSTRKLSTSEHFGIWFHRTLSVSFQKNPLL